MIEWTEWIRSELFILVPVLYLLGIFLKKSPVKDWLIPYVLCGVGVVLSAVYLIGQGVEANGGLWNVLFSAVTQGVLCAACSVYAKNLVKQFQQRKDETVQKDEQEESDPKQDTGESDADVK